MQERVLSQRQLNRAVLARQLVLERAHVPLVQALEDESERLAAFHADRSAGR